MTTDTAVITSSTEQSGTDAVSRLLAAVVAGTGVPEDLYAPDAVLDATVPMWRFAQHGPRAAAGQLSHWFDSPATLSEVVRTPLPYGELVTFTLAWYEDGEPMAARQVHVIELAGDRITRQQVWCGGRWDRARQEEMAAAR